MKIVYPQLKQTKNLTLRRSSLKKCRDTYRVTMVLMTVCLMISLELAEQNAPL